MHCAHRKKMSFCEANTQLVKPRQMSKSAFSDQISIEECLIDWDGVTFYRER